MADSPLSAHTASPRELQERIAAERRGQPFLLFRDGDGDQVIVDLETTRDHATIGRREGSDVCLSWDSEVSRLHAELERLGEDWVIVDDGLSHNGTFVNGERVVARRRLRDGDTIAIGGTQIVFRAPSGGSITAPTVTAAGPVITADLTPAQRRVLTALCRPYGASVHATPATNQQIADELFVSIDAVKSTLRALFEIFGVDALPQNSKRAQLALRALQSGVISRRDL